MLDKSWQVGTSLEDMTALLILHHGLPEPNRENNKGIPCSPFLYSNTADMLKPVSGGKILNFIFMIFKLNFPNGNVQEYGSLNDLNSAARNFGGEAKYISQSGDTKTYAFVQK